MAQVALLTGRDGDLSLIDCAIEMLKTFEVLAQKLVDYKTEMVAEVKA